MHERKNTMFELADAFVTLPGGVGTLDETFEMITWRYLGYHEKPIIILNHDRFYDHLIAQIDHCEREGVIREELRSGMGIVTSVNEVFALLGK
jgi:hypothetical protein